MFVVSFYENKNLLLSQFLKTVPAVDESLTIKGRKAKVTSVETVDEKHVHVQLAVEKVTKNVAVIDNSKKKKR
jgi:hypothetical protein